MKKKLFFLIFLVIGPNVISMEEIVSSPLCVVNHIRFEGLEPGYRITLNLPNTFVSAENTENSPLILDLVNPIEFFKTKQKYWDPDNTENFPPNIYYLTNNNKYILKHGENIYYNFYDSPPHGGISLSVASGTQISSDDTAAPVSKKTLLVSIGPGKQPLINFSIVE